MLSRDSADADGVGLVRNDDLAVDVLIDGERVWSFNPRRDARRVAGLWHVPWPAPLRPHLDGIARVSAREHVSGTPLFENEVRFGSSTKPVRVRDKAGHPLAVNKTGHLGRSFDERDPAIVAGLLDAAERALTLLRHESGVDAFLAFGGLLGAVREGRLIGHDIDLDLGYLSRHTTPTDAIRESYGLERTFRRAGWRTWRFSGLDFKVLAPGLTTAARWIDVFGGFVTGGTFYLMPNVAAPAAQVGILPLGTIELEGRTLPAPARPETLLEATYGAGWPVPDPSFTFEVPRLTARRLQGWTRSSVANRNHWLPFYGSAKRRNVPEEPSLFARAVDLHEPDGSLLVDIGCGTGRDAVWFASRGRAVRGYDYVPSAVNVATAAARRSGLAAADRPRFATLNLYDARQVLTTGALLGREDRPLALYARFLLHALNDQGRANLFRLAGMSLRRRGRLYLEFRVAAPSGGAYAFGHHFRRPLDADQVGNEITGTGGRVEHVEQAHGLAPFGDEDPYVCRMVATWQR
ncbi:methyltransferase domain-containing protein [Jatrophihabitans fulvus]